MIVFRFAFFVFRCLLLKVVACRTGFFSLLYGNLNEAFS
jgi:hypothetical protein